MSTNHDKNKVWVSEASTHLTRVQPCCRSPWAPRQSSVSWPGSGIRWYATRESKLTKRKWKQVKINRSQQSSTGEKRMNNVWKKHAKTLLENPRAWTNSKHFKAPSVPSATPALFSLVFASLDWGSLARSFWSFWSFWSFCAWSWAHL